MNNDFYEEELRPYQDDKIGKWPTWVKVLIVKSWSAGAVFFFMFMSTAVFKLLSHPVDRWMLVMLVMVIINEFFINLLIKYMERNGQSMYKYAMFIDNKWSMVGNFFYIIGVVVATIFLGGFIISQGISLSRIFMPAEDATWEPIMFGFLYYGLDTLFIFIKTLIKNIINKHKVKHKKGDKDEI